MRPPPGPHARHWSLDPDVTFLNHGSFGACPTVVLEAQQAYRRSMESNPVRFLARELPGLLDDTRHRLAGALGAVPEQLLLVTNATSGVNAVLSSFGLTAGDEVLITPYTYRACAHAVRHTAAVSGASVVVAPLRSPVTGPDEAVAAILAGVTPATRLAVIDHVTSPTATVLPVAEIAPALAARGVATLIDGAHGPGMIERLDLASLPGIAYVGNCHKWLLSPKGAGFIHADMDFLGRLTPTVVSHGWNPGPPSAERTRAMFDWTGTADPTALLATRDALGFISETFGGVDELAAANRAVALRAATLLSARLGIEACAPPEMTGSMVAFPLPGTGAPHDRQVVDPLQAALFERWRIEIPVVSWQETGQRFLRVSAQAYTTVAQIDYLAEAVHAEGL